MCIPRFTVYQTNGGYSLQLMRVIKVLCRLQLADMELVMCPTNHQPEAGPGPDQRGLCYTVQQNSEGANSDWGGSLHIHIHFISFSCLIYLFN